MNIDRQERLREVWAQNSTSIRYRLAQQDERMVRMSYYPTYRTMGPDMVQETMKIEDFHFRLEWVSGPRGERRYRIICEDILVATS